LAQRNERTRLLEVNRVGGIHWFVFRLMFFFFSSRRRHTRSDRDWSSDVCSSDLDATGRALARTLEVVVERGVLEVLEIERRRMRSEERRVGKECRSRWEPQH